LRSVAAFFRHTASVFRSGNSRRTAGFPKCGSRKRPVRHRERFHNDSTGYFDFMLHPFANTRAVDYRDSGMHRNKTAENRYTVALFDGGRENVKNTLDRTGLGACRLDNDIVVSSCGRHEIVDCNPEGIGEHTCDNVEAGNAVDWRVSSKRLKGECGKNDYSRNGIAKTAERLFTHGAVGKRERCAAFEKEQKKRHREDGDCKERAG
jgi:hypothetical protein